ncbi:hypothetical protein J4H92_09690 [Leucobacter weissii]|uniref:5-bromo-4-chloroindolyl phosphate hydrolysis protein n=1 Tax=Leucobacter weissii TaxID=1983706 RepID=A0A939SAR2_9MICO|nr:hypothetical protein [Leucobacter weissii]MBO1902217.1 hypothetical protein [Leucobacter weissii]
MSLRPRTIGLGLGAAAAALAGFGLALGLQLALPLALPIAAVVGVGVGLLAAPARPSELVRLGVMPTTTAQALDAAAESAAATARAVGRLRGRPVWGTTGLDGELLALGSDIEGLAGQPALRSRSQTDGDVQTLFTLATDYLPTIVNLAIENDRMHASFSGGRPRAEIARNVEGLQAQTRVLGEVLERIESDVVRGVSRDAEQHAEFLRMRFAQTGAPELLDLSVPRQAPPPTIPDQPSNRPEHE